MEGEEEEDGGDVDNDDDGYVVHEQELCAVLTVYLCVLCVSQNKQ